VLWCIAPSRLTLCFTTQAVRINLALIDHCHSLMLGKDGQSEAKTALKQLVLMPVLGVITSQK